METKIFDRETILDLMVNFIPLGIIFFFIAAFAIVDPWGFDLVQSGLMFAIMGVMFVALSVLTYLSAKAIAGDEKRATVYAQGQAGLKGAKPIHEVDGESTAEVEETAAEPTGDETGESESTTDEQSTDSK